MHHFWSRLSDPKQWWLVVRDRGTVGLGGPERAGVPAEQNNFADFVWNFGIPNEDEHTGGTYGCGRTVFFTASAPSARDPEGSVAVIHSRYRANDCLRTRLIAMGLGDNYTKSGRLYTGRHWWGRERKEALSPAPLENPLADVLAQSLGLPGFKPGETGTTVLVPCCDLRAEEEDGQAIVKQQAALDVMNRLIGAAAWHCWPKIVDLGPGPEMVFSFLLNGQEIRGPCPERHPEIRHFIPCLRACLGDKPPGVEVESLLSQRPKQRLGCLAMNRFPEEPGPSPMPSRPFEGAVRHTALMRAPKLIVKYLPGAESPWEGTGWAGVFLANDEKDAEFAAAEPPPHDDWVVRPGKKFKRNLVRIALARIDKQVKRFNGGSNPLLEQNSEPLGRLADALGDLLVGGPSGGPGRERPRRASERRRHLARIEQGQARLESAGGRRLLLVPFRVLPKYGTSETLVETLVDVAINDGSSSEREAPDGIPMPELRGYLSPAGALRRVDKIKVLASDTSRWEVVVDLPVDVAVRVRLRALPAD